MRHGDKNNNLSRTASHRKALLSNLACQLFEHKRITTTLAKAKALRPYVEPLLTKAKQNTTHQRRIVFGYLQDKVAVQELFDVIAAKIAARPGGYTRVIKLGKRVGDNAELGMIELVDFNEIYGKHLDSKEETTAKRTRRAGSKKKAVAAETTTEAPLATEAPAEKAAEPTEEPKGVETSEADAAK